MPWARFIFCLFEDDIFHGVAARILDDQFVRCGDGAVDEDLAAACLVGDLEDFIVAKEVDLVLSNDAAAA